MKTPNFFRNPGRRDRLMESASAPAAAVEHGHMTVVSSLASAALDDAKRAVEGVVLRPGLSLNGNFYSPSIIAAVAPLLEGARAFADHNLASPLRSMRDLVGYYTAPHVGDDGALRATLNVSKTADWLWTLIQEALTAKQPHLVGISVDLEGDTRPGLIEGKRARIVTAINGLNSADVVTRASASGQIERLLQADNQSWWDSWQPANETAVALQDAAAATGQTIATQQSATGGVDATHEGPFAAGVVPATHPVQSGPTLAANISGGRVLTGQTYITEGESDEMKKRRLLREANGTAAGGTATTVQLTEAQATALTSLASERRIFECEKALHHTLSQSGLPGPVVRSLNERFSGRVFEGEELQNAITTQRGVLAELTDLGMIRGMGYERKITTGLSEIERIQAAFDGLFDIQEGAAVTPLSGIREAYVMLTGDTSISGVSAPSRLQEADVTTASFSFLLGTSMNKRLLKDYQAWPSEWQKFATITPIKDFRQQDRVRLGAFGSLSTVPEDTAYTQLTVADTRATYSPSKRGNLVSVTRETIVNDDLYAIRQIPGKLAVSAAFTLAEFAYSFLTATTNIYDANPLFTKNAPHLNSAVVTPGTPNTGVGLSSAGMQSGVTAVRRQTNAAGKPIGLKPRYLIVAPELEWQGMVVTKSAGAPGANFNDINPMLGYAEVIVAPQLSSATGWYLACDPRVIDTIEVGFVGGQVNPVLFIQDQPLFGANFTNDVITYKVRHEYGGAVVDYRGFYQGNN